MNRRAVIVTQLRPLNAKKAQEFLRRLTESITTIVRPGIVLDCSSLDRLDADILDLLLCCLEEALKCNGDVRLAALHPDVGALLDSIGAGSLFQIFTTVNEATESFRRPAFGGVQTAEIPVREVLPSADAA